MWENEHKASGSLVMVMANSLALSPQQKTTLVSAVQTLHLKNCLSTQIGSFFHSHGYLEQKDYPVPPDTWMGQKIRLGEHLLGAPLALQPSPAVQMLT